MPSLSPEVVQRLHDAACVLLNVNAIAERSTRERMGVAASRAWALAKRHPLAATAAAVAGAGAFIAVRLALRAQERDGSAARSNGRARPRRSMRLVAATTRPALRAAQPQRRARPSRAARLR
jgi:hypothetical protein